MRQSPWRIDSLVIRPERVFAAALIALFLIRSGVAADAVAKHPAPPFPKGRDAPAVARWMRRYALASPTLAVALSDDVVYALLPNTDPQPQDYARAIVEADVLRPGYVPVFGGRSAKLALDIDCKGTRLRLMALTVYPRPKFKGRPSARPAAGDWLPPPPASTLQSIWRSVCDPQFIRPLTTEQTLKPSRIPERK